MQVYCEDCGYREEIDGRTWSPKLNCPKCGIVCLKRDEIVKEENATVKPKRKYTKRVNSPKPVINQPSVKAGHLPALPEFSTDWDPTVQCEWLRQVGRLIEVSK